MTAPSLFGGFFDDAALFPPGNAPMDEAVSAHLARHGTPAAEMVGPFVCSVVRLAKLRRSLGDRPLDLALVGTGDELSEAIDTLTAQRSLNLVAVELKGASLPALPLGVRAFVERPWDDLDVPGGAMLKLRCGGPSPEDTPSAEELGAAIAHCVERDLAFKLTAGLHHAVRTGHQHGFLNALAAVAAAVNGDDPVPVLTETDPAALKVTDPDHVRRLFRSIGTCSIDEPLADLRALGLIA